MRTHLFLVIVVALGLVACNKNEAVLENTPAKHKAPVAKNIRVFNSLDEVSAEIDKTLSMSFEELVAYEATIGFNSFGKNADLAYNLVAENEDNFKSVAEVQSAISKYSEYLQLIEDKTDYTVETKLNYSVFKYIVNDEQMYQINDTLVKVVRDGKIYAPVKNYNVLSQLTDTDIENLKNTAINTPEKGPERNPDITDCIFAFEYHFWFFVNYTVKVYDCDGQFVSVTTHDAPTNVYLGRKIKKEDIQAGSDGRNNRLRVTLWMEEYQKTSATSTEVGALYIESHRKGIWNGIYWRTRRDIAYDIDAEIKTPTVEFISYSWLNAEYNEREIFRKFFIDYVNAWEFEPYFTQTRGYIRSSSNNNTVNYISFNNN